MTWSSSPASSEMHLKCKSVIIRPYMQMCNDSCFPSSAVVCLSVGGLPYLALLQIRSNALFIIIHLRETWTASESQNLQTIQYAKQNHNDHLIIIYSCPTKGNRICNWILMDQMEMWWAPFGFGTFLNIIEFKTKKKPFLNRFFSSFWGEIRGLLSQILISWTP